jgi:hypothetical protein
MSIRSLDLSGLRTVLADRILILDNVKERSRTLVTVGPTTNSGFAQYTDFGEQNPELNSDLGQ